MDDLEEVIITLNSMDDLDSFYNDMEAMSSLTTVPDRAVPVYRRRPISKNTHYMLSHAEVAIIATDPRVEGITFSKLAKAAVKPMWTSPTNTFDKSSTANSNHYNWGLKRCVVGMQIPNWGNNGTTAVLDSVSHSLSGKNVDVIIVDGHIRPDHPEFAKNADGTGGTRVNQFQWFTLNGTVASIDDDGTALTGSTYAYMWQSTAGSDMVSDNNHGCHVAGTVAGNTNGWARDANIYNISPYSTNPNTSMSSLVMWDYIRAFHRTKAINPATGRKNPTICNCSYGTSISWPDATIGTGPITQINYRGVNVGTVGTSATAAQLNAAKIRNLGGTATVPYYVSSVVSDIQQAIDDGVIIVGSAGNDSFFVDDQTGLDYNNYFWATYGGTSYSWYVHKGSAPGCATNVITVGSVGATTTEQKASYSNTGPGINIFAPGSNIASSFNISDVWLNSPDPRDSTFVKGKISGTSMASPQVTGVLACVLEMYPTMTQADAIRYIQAYSKDNQLTSGSGGISDSYDTMLAPNRYLYAYPERPVSNYVFPKINYWIRPASGQVYPRPKRRVYK
jgi:hypothetical protein